MSKAIIDSARLWFARGAKNDLTNVSHKSGSKECPAAYGPEFGRCLVHSAAIMVRVFHGYPRADVKRGLADLAEQTRIHQ